MKKGKALLILTVVLALLAGGFLAVKYLIPEETSDEDESIAVSTLDASKVASIGIAFDENAYLFSLEDGVWVCDAPADGPELDQTTLADVLTEACAVSATTFVTDKAEDFSAYGLDAPLLTIDVTLSDGTSTRYLVGSQNLITGEYYLNVDGTSDVYLVKSTFYSTFACDIAAFAAAETMPDTSSSTIDRYTLTLNDGTSYTYTYYADGCPDAYNYSEYWYYESPDYGPMTLDSYSFDSYIDKITGFSFTGAVVYEPSAEDLTEYGFDSPQAIVHLDYSAYTDAGTTGEITLLVGNTTEDEKHLYVMLEGGSFIYKIGQSTVTAITGMTPNSYICPLSLPLDISTVESVDIISGGVTYTVDYTHVSSTNSAGNEVTDILYTYNGEEFDDDTTNTWEQYLNVLRATYADVINLTPSAFDDSAPVVTVVVHRNTDTYQTLTLNFYPYDGSFDIADLNGLHILLFDKNTIKEWADSAPNFFNAL